MARTAHAARQKWRAGRHVRAMYRFPQYQTPYHRGVMSDGEQAMIALAREFLRPVPHISQLRLQ